MGIGEVWLGDSRDRVAGMIEEQDGEQKAQACDGLPFGEDHPADSSRSHSGVYHRCPWT